MPPSPHPWQFYAKVSMVCFLVGAAMETFMIHTGFYTKVVEIEAQRLEESREEREQFMLSLRDEVERQAARKRVGISLPEGKR